jgi:hypothetical protein
MTDRDRGRSPLHHAETDKGREYGGEVVKRADRAEEALALALQGKPGWVDGRVISAAWKSRFGPVPREIAGRWERTFEPAVRAGRVVSRVGARKTYYTLAEHQAEPLPVLDSDLARVEEALTRAVGRWRGAVTLEAVAAEGVEDPAVAIRSEKTSLGVFLQRLADTHRAREVSPDPRSRRLYYTTLDGPTTVASGLEYGMERRRRAIRALWRLAGGRPFTTRAVARFARSREDLRIEGDTKIGWTNAVQHLEREGFLTRVCDGELLSIRWAPTAAWDRLDPLTQAERQRDPYGRYSAPTVSVGDERRATASGRGDGYVAAGGPDSDVSCASRNRDVALLVRLSQEAAAERGFAKLAESATGALTSEAIRESANRRDAGTAGTQPVRHSVVEDTGTGGHEWEAGVPDAAEHANVTPESSRADSIRAILQARPVTEEAVDDVLQGREHLLGEGTTLAGALTEASRVRPGMVRAAVTRVGIVRNSAYYTGEREAGAVEDARAYVRFLLAQRVCDCHPIRLMTESLLQAGRLSVGRLVPLAASLLAARAGAVSGEAECFGAGLERAAEGARLLASEREEANGNVRSLRAHARSANRLLETLRIAAEAVGDTALGERIEHVADTSRVTWRLGQDRPERLLDIASAWSEVRELAPYAMVSPRALWARIHRSVRVIRPAELATVLDGATLVGAATPPVDGAVGAKERTKSDSGRSVANYMDRVGFALYVRLRWGGTRQRAFAAQATSALGSLRDSSLCAAELRAGLADYGSADSVEGTANASRTTHAATVCALGAFDDQVSREVLADYLTTAVNRPDLTTAAAAGLSAFGLRPSPAGRVTWNLSTTEREALTLAAIRHADERVRQRAANTIRMWDERWARERILRQ